MGSQTCLTRKVTYEALSKCQDYIVRVRYTPFEKYTCLTVRSGEPVRACCFLVRSIQNFNLKMKI